MAENRDVEQSEEGHLGIALIAYNDALMAALISLAEIKGIEDLSWMDNIQEAAVRSVMSSISGRIPEEAEEGALNFAAKVLGGAFRGIRTEITEGMTVSPSRGL